MVKATMVKKRSEKKGKNLRCEGARETSKALEEKGKRVRGVSSLREKGEKVLRRGLGKSGEILRRKTPRPVPVK